MTQLVTHFVIGSVKAGNDRCAIPGDIARSGYFAIFGKADDGILC